MQGMKPGNESTYIVHRVYAFSPVESRLTNLDSIRQIEAVKINQVNFTRIHFADFSATLDVYEKYEEVKMILSQARLALPAVEQLIPLTPPLIEP